MRGRKIGAAAGAILLWAVGCMKADRTVAVQMAVQTDGGGDAVPIWRPFSTPTLVTGLVSDTTNARGPSLTGDELEFYLSCRQAGESNFHILASTRSARDAAWNPAAMVNDLVGSVDDIDPDVSPDGLTLYFSSNRLTGGAAFRLFVSRRTTRSQPWGPPALVLGLGSSAADRGPSADPSGLRMVFARGVEPDIRLCSASRSDPLGAWETIEELSRIDANMDEESAAFFHGSLSLVWSSRGPSSGRTSDLFEVSRPDLSTSFPATQMALDTLNTQFWEGDPWVSQDGTHILFRREPVGLPGAIYEAWR